MQDAGRLSVPTKQKRATVPRIFTDYLVVRRERAYVKRDDPFRCDCKCQHYVFPRCFTKASADTVVQYITVHRTTASGLNVDLCK